MGEKIDHAELKKRFPYGYRIIGEPNADGCLVVGEPARTAEEWMARYAGGKIPEGPAEIR